MAPPKWLRMANFAQSTTFPILWNDQMQIVNSKLPNENIQTYHTQMTDSGGGGGGSKLSNANCGQQATNCNSTNHKHYFTCKALKMKSQFTFGSLPPPPLEPIICISKFFEIGSGRPLFLRPAVKRFLVISCNQLLTIKLSFSVKTGFKSFNKVFAKRQIQSQLWFTSNR